MTSNPGNSLLLLVAVLLATIRPVLAGNGLGLPVTPRGIPSSESSEEREGGESEQKGGCENVVEGRKVRRTVALQALNRVLLIGKHLLSDRGQRCGVSTAWCFSATSEHLHRWGVGAPLRI